MMPSMPRILHILDAADPAAHLARRAIRTLIDHAPAGVEHHVVLLGARADERAARALELSVAARIPIRRVPPPRLAGGALRRLLLRIRPDLLHAWSAGARRLAASAEPLLPVIETQRFDRAPYPMILPSPDARNELRSRWGAREGEVVLLLVGEPPEALDAFVFLVAAGVLAERGRPTLAIAHPDAGGLLRARRFFERRGRGARLIVDDLDPIDALPGADGAVSIALAPPGCARRMRLPPPTIHALAHAAAMGLVAVGEDRLCLRAAAIGALAGRIVWAPPRRPLEIGLRTARALRQREKDGPAPAAPPAISAIPAELTPLGWSAQAHARYAGPLTPRVSRWREKARSRSSEPA